MGAEPPELTTGAPYAPRPTSHSVATKARATAATMKLSLVILAAAAAAVAGAEVTGAGGAFDGRMLQGNSGKNNGASRE